MSVNVEWEKFFNKKPQPGFKSNPNEGKTNAIFTNDLMAKKRVKQKRERTRLVGLLGGKARNIQTSFSLE